MMMDRLSIYFSEQGRPLFVLFLAAVTTIAVQGMYETALGQHSIVIAPTLIVVVITYFLIFMHWRVADELKDRETDRRFFPLRPVPSGRVALSDLRALLIGITAAVFLINAIWSTAFVPFLVVFVYALLMSRWFFLERYLAPSRFMAVLTHSPTFALLNIYVIAWSAKRYHHEILSLDSLAIATWFVLHALSWEFARKAWAPSQEMPGYQTYSSVLGHRRAGMLPVVLMLAQWLALVWLCAHFDLSRWLLLLAGLPMLAFGHLCIRYALQPEHYAMSLSRMAPLYLVSIPLAVAIGCTVFQGVSLAI
jgi:4-hydroxybenzoate polyprenyltransferase